MTKRKMYWKKPGQGNSWDQYGDSSSAASASASAEEGGKGAHTMSERPPRGASGPLNVRAVLRHLLLNRIDYSLPIGAQARGQTGLAK